MAASMAACRDIEEVRLEVELAPERGLAGRVRFVWGRGAASDWLGTEAIVLEVLRSGRRDEVAEVTRGLGFGG
jgi:hypothetical protein